MKEMMIDGEGQKESEESSGKVYQLFLNKQKIVILNKLKKNCHAEIDRELGTTKIIEDSDITKTYNLKVPFSFYAIFGIVTIKDIDFLIIIS